MLANRARTIRAELKKAEGDAGELAAYLRSPE
jgi:hypothetical protein